MKTDFSNVKEFRDRTNKRIDKWVITHLHGFLVKNPQDKDLNEIFHIIDFLKSKEAPRRITRMGYETAKLEAQKWIERLNKKVVEQEIFEKDVVTKKKYPNGYSWVQLETKEAYDREGAKMGHCVSGYYGQLEKGMIYSLRDEHNQPHCTVEVRNHSNKKEVIQLRGKQNKQPVVKYVPYIRDMFLVKVNDTWIEKEYKISEFEKKNLYFYDNAGELLDLLELPPVVNFKNVITNYDMKDIALSIHNCEVVTFNEQVTMPVDVFSKRKNWTFKKGVCLLGINEDMELELDFKDIGVLSIRDNIQNHYDEDGNRIPKKKQKKEKFLLLKNVKTEIAQLTGDNFKFVTKPEIKILELDAKILDVNNFSLNLEVLNIWSPAKLEKSFAVKSEKVNITSIDKTFTSVEDVSAILAQS